jgi:hypothetical protein
MNNAEAQAYYQTAGRLMALGLLFGVTDQHQGNLIVSGKQPYLTDVEIAASPHVLKLAAFMQGKNPNNPLPPSAYNECGLYSVGMEQGPNTGALGRYYEGEVACPFQVDNTGMLKNVAPQVNSPTLNNVVVDNGDGTGPHIMGGHLLGANQPAVPSNDWNTLYGPDIRTGFMEVINALRNPANNTTLRGVADNMAGMHVRYHPTPTGTQLQRLQNARNRPDENGFGWLETSIAREEGTDPQRQDFVGSMVSDISRGDVPYYTRTIGGNQALHNGTTAVPNFQFPNDGGAAIKAQIQAIDANSAKILDHITHGRWGGPPPT